MSLITRELYRVHHTSLGEVMPETAIGHVLVNNDKNNFCTLNGLQKTKQHNVSEVMLGSQSKQAFSHSKKEISRFKGHFVIWCWAMLMTATWSS